MGKISVFSKKGKLRFSHRFPFFKMRDDLKIKFEIHLFKNHQIAHILKFPQKDLNLKLNDTIMLWFIRITFKKAQYIKIVNQFSGSHTINNSAGEAMWLE